MKEGAAFPTVIALRSQIRIAAQLTAQNQDSSAIGFHCLKGIEGNHLIDLSGPGVVDAKALSASAVAFDRAKGRITDDDIHLLIRPIYQGIFSGELGIVSGGQFKVAIWVDLVDDRPLGRCRYQQCSIPRSGLIHPAIRDNPCQDT
ncbi:MAG: hypothetical protein AAFR99_21970, partial [Cyanobacteria bacterium J06629_9]